MLTRKRTIIVLATIILLLILGVGSGLALLVLHEPGFYARGEVAPGRERVELAKICVGKLAALIASITNQGDWAGDIGDQEFNSFFAEDFMKWGESEALRRVGISNPRIVFEEERIRLAFRYGSGFFSTIISLDVKVWPAPQDPNVVAVEFQGRHAGSLPISAQSLLEILSAQARERNIEINWYRHSGNPVALVRFQANRLRPTFQLSQLELSSGKITIAIKNVPEAATY